MGKGVMTSSPTQQALATLPQGNNVHVTLEELEAKAQTLAQQIMQLPEANKDSELIQLKKANPTLHALVKSCIEQMRQQAKTTGGAMVMQQQGMGGGGGMPPQGGGGA
jgi:DNA repair exonuclease SbcCD ATPase subunit